MPKRRTILLLLACGILAVGTVIIRNPSREPSYHGRNLGAWVVEYGHDVQVQHDRGRDESLGTGTASEDAIRQIGTNAIPWLLSWMRYQEPRWKHKLRLWVKGLPPSGGVRSWLEDQQDLRARGAMLAFRALGSQAKTALPELIRLLNSPGKTPGASRAGQAAAAIGADALPGFLSALTNADPGIRCDAAFHVQYLGTNGLAATPQLLATLSDADGMVVWATVQTLGMLKADPPLIVPRLQSLLGDADPHRRIYGAMGLAHYAALATSAVPTLLITMNTTNQEVYFWSRKAILAIDPQALTSLSNP